MSFNNYLGLEKVELSKEEISIITMTAEALDIPLPGDFFSLGNLRNNKLKSAMAIYGGGSSLEGSDTEITKYRTIKELKETINEALCLIPIGDHFKNYKSIELAICNSGTLADQSISISITIPKASYVTVEDLLTIDSQILEEVLYERSSDRFFYIKRTASVLDYDESVRNKRFHARPVPALPFESFRDKTDDYRQELENIFPYYLSVDGGNLTITVEFDEVLHHTNVAFPSVILLNSNIETIDYSIRSRNMPTVVKGVLHHQE